MRIASVTAFATMAVIITTMTAFAAMTWLAGRAEVQPNLRITLQGQDAVVELVNVDTELAEV